jgi:hypothetical protein
VQGGLPGPGASKGRPGTAAPAWVSKPFFLALSKVFFRRLHCPISSGWAALTPEESETKLIKPREIVLEATGVASDTVP